MLQYGKATLFLVNAMQMLSNILLDVFGRWDLALISKFLAFGAWLLLRDRPAARLAAWIIAPLSLLALLHDLLLLIP